MSKLTKLICLATFFAAILLSFPLLAQSDDDRQRAEELYREGAKAYHSGDFSLAIMKFKSGNQLDPNPMFLYNIAVAYGRLGNVEEAHDYGVRAQAGSLPPEPAQKNMARLRSWKLAMHAKSISETLSTPTEAGCTSDAQCQTGQQCNLESQQCVEPPPPVVQAESPFPRLLGWTGIGLAAIGLGLTTGAIILSSSLSSDFEQHEQARARQDNALADQIAADIESSQSTGKILLFAGIGTAAAGTTLIVVDLLTNSEQSTALYPTVSDDSVGVGFHTHF